VLAQLNASSDPSVLADEATRIAGFENISAAKAAVDAEAGTRTAAMIMTEAAASLLAQANYSRQQVSELLTFMPSKSPVETG
jgi:hypothetical protein